MPIPLNDKYMTEAAATTATRTNFDLLAIPIGVKSEQYERRSKNRPQNAAGAVFCGGVKVVHRRILVS
jgi:hypothetical protein